MFTIMPLLLGLMFVLVVVKVVAGPLKGAAERS
jgi:hypothetical protein